MYREPWLFRSRHQMSSSCEPTLVRYWYNWTSYRKPNKLLHKQIWFVCFINFYDNLFWIIQHRILPRYTLYSLNPWRQKNTSRNAQFLFFCFFFLILYCIQQLSYSCTRVWSGKCKAEIDFEFFNLSWFNCVNQLLVLSSCYSSKFFIYIKGKRTLLLLPDRLWLLGRGEGSKSKSDEHSKNIKLLYQYTTIAIVEFCSIVFVYKQMMFEI